MKHMLDQMRIRVELEASGDARAAVVAVSVARPN